MNKKKLFEFSDEGAFFTVFPHEKDTLDIKTVKRDLVAQNVINANYKKIQEVINLANGDRTRIGDNFEVFDFTKKDFADIETTDLEAFIKLKESLLSSGRTLNFNELIFLLNHHNVYLGIDENAIFELSKNPVFEKWVKVASGISPTPGLDAKAEEKIKIDSTMKPQELLSGKVDLKALDFVHNIDKDTVILVKYLPTKGKPGRSIFDTELPAPDGKDVTILAGKNTYWSEDRSRLLSKTGGFVYRSIHGIEIEEIFLVKGNVDYSTGNIKYKGDVVVFGNVLTGFEIDAGGDIKVNGIIEGSNLISRNGSIEIKGAVFGQQRATIRAKKNITFGRAQDATFISEGTIFIHEYALHCQLKGEQGLATTHQGASVVGGQVISYNYIEIHESGSDKKIQTILNIKDKNEDLNSEKLQELTNLKTKLDQSLLSTEKSLRLMKKMIEQVKVINDKSKEKLEKAVNDYYAAKNKINYINQRIADVKSEKEKPKDLYGFVNIIENCYEGTKIVLYHAEAANLTKKTNIKYILEDAKIADKSLDPAKPSSARDPLTEEQKKYYCRSPLDDKINKKDANETQTPSNLAVSPVKEANKE